MVQVGVHSPGGAAQVSLPVFGLPQGYLGDTDAGWLTGVHAAGTVHRCRTGIVEAGTKSSPGAVDGAVTLGGQAGTVGVAGVAQKYRVHV